MSVSREMESGFVARLPRYGRTLDCVHCGLCLPQCPTYRASGREADSPRGRIYLLRRFAEDPLELSRAAQEHLDLCIVCRNCESVCPAGIRMGDMMESFRDAGRRRERGFHPGRFLARLLLERVIPSRPILSALTDLVAWGQWCRLDRLVRAAGRILPPLRDLDLLVPPMPPRRVRRIDAEAAAAGGLFRTQGRPRARVGLFLGCIASQWYAPVHRATIRVLLKNGCDVVVPAAQTCCGALHRHAGHLDSAARLFEKNSRVFQTAGIDVLAVNSAGCGAALKEAPEGLPGGLGVPVRDICELLQEIGITRPQRPLHLRVAYHQACHLAHAQRIGPGAVEDLLRRIPGLQLLPLVDGDQCCGAGGVFNLMHRAMSQKVLEAKTAAILASGADAVATGNPGCWLQIRAGLRRRGGAAVKMEVVHPVELLDRAYGNGNGAGNGIN